MERISSLTALEWIELKATLKAIEDKKYNCSECLKQYQGRKDRVEMLEKVRNSKGCKTLQADYIHQIDDEIFFKGCIGNFFRIQMARYLEMARMYDKGVLPFAGSLGEQPAKIIEIFRIIEQHRTRQMAREQERLAQAKRRAIARGR